MRYRNILLGLVITGVLGVGVLWFSQVSKETNLAQNALEASYQNSFFNLIENFENLDVLLGKILASNSDDRDIITLVTVWSMAEVAKTNLGNLPLGSACMMNSSNYLAQLGDFSYSLGQKLAKNQAITENEWQMVRQLHQENRAIHNELRDLLGLMQDKQITFGSLRKENVELTPDNDGILAGFGKLDERLQNEVPTLTYDGPFSDHVVNREPRGLTGEMIDQPEAENIALQFANKINPQTQYSVNNTSWAEGRLPSYSVTLQSENSDQSPLVLGISKKGGHIVFMMATGEPIQDQKVNFEQAIETSQEFVQELELGTFLLTGYLVEGNELLANYALLQDEVILYPDMVQVMVSLDSGNIVAYDAKKYLLSHTERSLPSPKITAADATNRVNAKLQIEQVRLALIPLGNLHEQLTYEIKGEIDEETYYVYINAETGFQEKILLIVETPQGSRSI